MKITINNRFTGAIIFACEAETLREAVERAIKARISLTEANLAGASLAYASLAYADLAGASLAGANLAGASLAHANLAHASLAHASLADANLADANLAGASLAGASLAHASLAYADLAYASLAYADLAGADLTNADLTGTNLYGAILKNTCLDPANEANGDAREFSVDGEYVIGYRTRSAPHIGEYRDGRIYAADVFSTCTETECHPGLYLWPTIKHAKDFSGNTEFIKVHTRARDVHHVGKKWRCRWFEVSGKA